MDSMMFFNDDSIEVKFLDQLKNEIVLINKKSKYNQTNYLKELDKLDSKIKNERELIHNIEKELL